MGRSRREGRLLSGHEVSRVGGSGAAGRSVQGQHGGAAAVMRARPLRKLWCQSWRLAAELSAWLDGLAVSSGDGVGDQGDVTGVEVAEDGAQADGDGGVAEAGGDPQDGLLGGGAGPLGFPSQRGEILLGERSSPVEETRRKFDADFKEGAVRLVRETGKPIAQVARELGVKEGTLGNWVNADRRRRDGEGGQLSEDERAELVRLRRKCAELELRCDVLKRSVALWVDEAMGR